MAGSPLRLPQTPAGRAELRRVVRLSGGWTFPDGTAAPDYDWDKIGAEVEAFADGPNPFDFWVPLLNGKGRDERLNLIGLAFRHGVIDDRTADTLSVMWSDRDREGR